MSFEFIEDTIVKEEYQIQQFSLDLCQQKCIDHPGLGNHVRDEYQHFELETVVSDAFIDDLPLIKSEPQDEGKPKSELHGSQNEERMTIDDPSFETADQIVDDSSMSRAGNSGISDKSPKTFCCYTCSLIFTKFKSYRIHYSSVHPDMIEKDDRSKNGWDETSFVPIVPKKMLCKYCLKTFNDPVAFQSHAENAHHDKLYTCPHCPKSFSLKTDRTRHVNTHKGRARYKCPHCPKAYTTHHNLKDHINSHLSIKRFVCRFCGKSFVKKTNLQRHELIHTKDNEGRFRCSECSLHFKNASHLDFHMQEHTNPKIYKCPHCVKAYNCSKLLDEHSLTHKNERPLSPDMDVFCAANDENNFPSLQYAPRQGDQIDSGLHLVKQREEIMETSANKDPCEDGAQLDSPTSTSDESCETFCCYSCGNIFTKLKAYRRHYRAHHPEMIETDDSSKYTSEQILFVPKVPKEMLCKYCLQTFNEAAAYHSHMENDHPKKLYTCPHCPKTFSNPSHQRDHIKRPLKTKSFSCQFCDEQFAIKCSLQCHELWHMDERPFRCNDCSLNFKDANQLDSHMQEHTGAKKYNCPYCEKAFLCSQNMKQHILSHKIERQSNCDIEQHSRDVDSVHNSKALMSNSVKTDLPEQNKADYEVFDDEDDGMLSEESQIQSSKKNRSPFCCYSCGTTFMQFHTYRIHYRIQHPDMIEMEDNSRESRGQSSFVPKIPKQMLCKYCLNIFTDPAAYHSHIENHHSHKLYRCPHCPKSFREKHLQNLHINAHEGKRPHKCPYCPDAFKTRSTLKAHIMFIHMNISSFACRFCDKKFKRKPSLKRHEGIHTAERKFWCNECDLKFSDKAKLNLHIREHTNMKDYVCPHCDKIFACSTFLKEHILTHRDDGLLSSHIEELTNENLSQDEGNLPSDGAKADSEQHCTKQWTNISKMEVYSAKDEHIVQTSVIQTANSKQGCEPFDSHMEEQTKNFKCPHCEKAFHCSPFLEEHILAHKNEVKKYENNLQDIDEDSFPSPKSKTLEKAKSDLELHCGQREIAEEKCSTSIPLETSTTVKFNENCETFCCYSCGFIFVKIETYRRHYISKHPDMIGTDNFTQDSCELPSFVPKVPKAMLCKYCLKTFNDPATYHSHMENEHPMKLYTCPHCPKSFQRKGNRDDHVHRHQGKRPYKCPHCPMSFPAQSNMRNHIFIHFNIKPFSCRFCDKKFERKAVCLRHEQTHSDERSFPCNDCNLKFTDESLFDSHMKEHTNPKNYNCPHCNKTFHCTVTLEEHTRTHRNEPPSSCDIEEHIQVHVLKKDENLQQNAHEDDIFSAPHPEILDQAKSDSELHRDKGDIKFPGNESSTSNNTGNCKNDFQTESFDTFCCYSCGSIFVEFGLYRKHYWGQHPEMIENDDCERTSFVPKVPERMLCKYCLTPFNDPAAYHSHMANAHPNKIYTCLYCPKTFTLWSRRNNHADAHGGIKSYKCLLCRKAFKLVSQLRSHADLHAKKRQFECRFCNKICGREYDLKRHELVHMNVKQLKCIKCDLKFSDREKLDLHMRIHMAAQQAKT